MNKAIELLKLEIERIQHLVGDLRRRKLIERASYRQSEVYRFQVILDLLEEENHEH
jgi:uncharacterized membrane protein